MANTANVVLGSAWTKITTDTSSDFLASTHEVAAAEFAVTTADVTPTLAQGHRLQPGDALTRSVTGVGYVWARAGAKYPAQTVLVVTK